MVCGKTQLQTNAKENVEKLLLLNLPAWSYVVGSVVIRSLFMSFRQLVLEGSLK